jgi:hypothetical protein
MLYIIDNNGGDMDIVDIVKKYRGSKSLRKFAKELAVVYPITYGAVYRWERGIEPSFEYLNCVRMYSSLDDWRHAFAVEVLTAKYPSLVWK